MTYRIRYHLASALFALAIGVVPVGAARAIDAGELDRALVGRWTATLSGQPRPLTLEVFSVAAKGAQAEADAYWGFSDGSPVKTPLAVTTDGDAILLSFDAPSGHYDFRSTSADRFAGTFTFKSTGKQAKVQMKAEPLQGRLFAPGAKPTAKEINDALEGTWLVKVGKNENLRSFQIRSVEAKGDGYIGKALYGLADGDPTPRNMAVDLNANGAIVVDFKGSATTHIRARLASEDEMQGVWSTDRGAYAWINFKVSDEIAKEPVAKGKPSPKLTFLYIAAGNCPNCTYSSDFSSNPATSKRGLMNSPYGKVVTYREILANTYMDTGDIRFWPDDLKWIREKTYVASGTPRFVLVGDDNKVYANVRRNTLDKLIKKIGELKQIPPA